MILQDIVKLGGSYYCDGCTPPEEWDDIVPVYDDEFENDEAYPICKGCGKVHDEVFIACDVAR